MRKSDNELTIQTLQDIISLSKNIVSGNENVAYVEMGLSIENTFEKPLFRSVFKGENAKIGFSVVRVLVTRFMESFGFSTKMSDNQIDTLTVDTLEKFNYETLDDIILFFKMARSGSFGATKKGVDSNLIYGEWFPMYLEKKAEIREQNYSIKKGETSRMQATDDDVKATYEKLKQKNIRLKVENHVDEITKNFDRQLLEDLIVDWEKDPIKKPYLDILKCKRKIITK